MKRLTSNIMKIFRALTILIAAFFAAPFTAFAGFSDVPFNHENYSAIIFLEENGVIEGYNDGTFKPDQQVNRAEFLKMLYETIGMSGYDPVLPFTDVPQNEWFTQYVKEAYHTGVINGYPDGTYKPGNSINFAEAIKIVLNGFFNVDAFDTENVPCAKNYFDPSNKIVPDKNQWYWKYINVADNLCIIDFNSAAHATDGLDVGALITRGDMAEFLYRANAIYDLGFYSPGLSELHGYSEEYEPPPLELPTPDQGTVVEDSIYTNPTFDLSVFIPDDWYIFSNEEMDSSFQVDIDLLGSADPQLRTDLNKGLETVHPLIMASKYAYLSDVEVNPNIILQADYIGASMGETAQDHLKFGRDVLENSPIDYTGSEIYGQDVGGIEFAALDLELIFDEAVTIQRQYAKEFFDFILVITLSAGNEEELAELEQIVDSIMFGGQEDSTDTDTTDETMNNESPEIVAAQLEDNELLGNWQSDCLVPDPNSDWAVRHTFKIDSQYAIHTREEWYAPNCSGSGATKVTEFSYVIPTKGEINLTETISGMMMYDIYQISDGTLVFGHGYRNNPPYSTSIGASEEDRITTPNNYIIYKKQ